MKDEKLEVAMSSTSTAHTYGNVTCFVTEYLKGLFPNYFKNVHVSSTIAYRQFSIFANRQNKMLKKDKPLMIIRPRIELNNDDMYMSGTYLTSRLLDVYMERDFSNLQPLIRDDNTKVNIKYLLNRLKISYDVSIMTNTQMDQINMANYFRNRVRQNAPFFVSTSLESQLPRPMLEIMAKEAGIEMYDKNGGVSDFLKYLNGRSMNPITYKMKSSSGNDEFFRYYHSNLLMTISDLNIDDGNKKGQIFDYFTTSFSVSVEFNTPGLYYYFTESNKYKNTLQRMLDPLILENSDNATIIPLFTISNLFEIPVNEGWNLYATTIFKVDKESGDVDDIDLSPFHNESMLEFIKYHKENAIPIRPFIKVFILKDNAMLVETVDYDIDDLMTNIKLYNLNPYSSYRLVIHTNTLYINEVMGDLYEKDKNAYVSKPTIKPPSQTPQEVIDEVFKDYIKPTLDIQNNSISFGTCEYGDDIYKPIITIKFIKGSHDIKSMRIIRNGILLEDVTFKEPTDEYVIEDNITVSDTTEYSFIVTDAMNEETIQNKSFKFVYPTFCGVLPKVINNPTEKDLLDEYKYTIEKSDLDVSFRAINSKAYIAYPATYGELSSITASILGGLNAVNAFEQRKILLTMNDGRECIYQFYIGKNAFTTSDTNEQARFIFKF